MYFYKCPWNFGGIKLSSLDTVWSFRFFLLSIEKHDQSIFSIELIFYNYLGEILWIQSSMSYELWGFYSYLWKQKQELVYALCEF